MKRILSYLFVSALLAMPLGAKQKSDTTGAPAITFAETSHDFGTIKEKNGWVEHSFTYTNSGTAPLAIVTVSASCGCTKPEFDAKPLAPGKKGKIKVRFTPEGSKGEFSRKVIVRTNVKGRDGKAVLTIKGVIIPK
jgi:hypothetical protein